MSAVLLFVLVSTLMDMIVRDDMTAELNEYDIRMMRELSENVERGAKFLDSLDLGDAWYKQIETEHLDLASGTECIAGQLFMSYLEDSIRLYDHGFHYLLEEYFDGDTYDAAYYGFNLHQDLLHKMDDDGEGYEWLDKAHYFGVGTRHHIYEFLAVEWIVQIEKRKAEAGEML